MANTQKSIPVLVSLRSVGIANISGDDYIDFNQRIITLISDICNFGRLTKLSETRIKVMSDNDPKKAYLQSLADMMLKNPNNERVRQNLSNFGVVVLENKNVLEQAYVDGQILNWQELIKILCDPNFLFVDSNLPVVLMQESKRLNDLEKNQGMSK